MTTQATNPPQTLRVSAIRYAARDTLLFELSREDWGILPEATAGAHIDVTLPNDIMRQYSLIHAGNDLRGYTVGVKRDPASRGGSSYMHEALRVGQLLEVNGPRNSFPLKEDAPHSVMIAGGIGITPIWCMIQRLAELGQSWELHYSSRSREDAAFLHTLQDFGPVYFNFDEENQGQFLDLPKIVSDVPVGAHFYCCGPQPMLKAFEAATQALPSDQIHLEYFGSKYEAAAEGGYTVELAKSGQTFEIPEGRTILDILRDAGIAVNFSCEQGTCGACETKVLEGVPDHRDSLLSDEEQAANDTMMICCSGSKGARLVLDL
jgi:ferredoxin-NADP reductase